MLTEDQAREVIGATAYGDDGEKIGKVGQLFLDDQTGRPEFVTVNTGLFGTSESFVPVADATFNGDRLVVPFSKDKVKDAPNVDLDGRHLDESEEQRLYDYYGMADLRVQPTTPTRVTPTRTARREYAETDRTARLHRHGHRPRPQRHQRHRGPRHLGPDHRRRDDPLRGAGRGRHTSQEAGRARLRKYVTTEQETHTVPVRKEKAVLETEPITDGNVGDATSGPDISEEEHEVVLREERATVDKTVEPVERVRLGTETTTEEETVTEEVRKEHIEVEGDADRR